MLGTVRGTTVAVAVETTVACRATVFATETTGGIATSVVATERCATVLAGFGKTVATVRERTVGAVSAALETATLRALFLHPGWTLATEIGACGTVETTVLPTVEAALWCAVKATAFGRAVRAGKTT